MVVLPCMAIILYPHPPEPVRSELLGQKSSGSRGIFLYIRNKFVYVAKCKWVCCGKVAFIQFPKGLADLALVSTYVVKVLSKYFRGE